MAVARRQNRDLFVGFEFYVFRENSSNVGAQLAEIQAPIVACVVDNAVYGIETGALYHAAIELAQDVALVVSVWAGSARYIGRCG